MKHFIVPITLIILSFSSCETKKEEAITTSSTTDSIKNDSIQTGDNSQNSVDWEGTYEGTIPCADCEGIKTTLELKDDNTYKLSSEYLGKKNKFEEDGKFTWSKDGNSIKVLMKDGQYTNYIVGENILVQLDQEGNKITGTLADKYKLYKK